MHDVIDVYWTSIEVRDGFVLYKYYCESRFVPQLQSILQQFDPAQEKVSEENLTTLYNTFCRKWDALFEGIDCWNTIIIHDSDVVYRQMYQDMKELCYDLRILALKMKPKTAFEVPVDV